MTDTTTTTTISDERRLSEIMRDETTDRLTRRYAAGVLSLIDRADPAIEILETRGVAAPGPYSDYDLVFRASLGGEEIPGEEPANLPGWLRAGGTARTRAAVAIIESGLHVSGSRRITLGPVHASSSGMVRVWSASEDAYTDYFMRPEDVEALARRVVLEFALQYLSDMEIAARSVTS